MDFLKCLLFGELWKPLLCIVCDEEKKSHWGLFLSTKTQLVWTDFTHSSYRFPAFWAIRLTLIRHGSLSWHLRLSVREMNLMKRACCGSHTVCRECWEDRWEAITHALSTLVHECVLAAHHIQYCLQIPSLAVCIIDVASLYLIKFSKWILIHISGATVIKLHI